MKNLIVSLAVAVITLPAIAQGTYTEFKMSSNDAPMGVTKTYYQDGNMRTESQTTPSATMGGMNFAMVMLKSKPDVMYMLDEKGKTYMEISTAGKQDMTKHEANEYTVTVVGKEKVNGYNAVHVKVKVNNSPQEEDIWTSTEVANYAKYKGMTGKYTSDNMYKALAAKGADGFAVRVKTVEHSHSVQLDLVKCETRNNPASLFSLDGYTKSEGAPGMGNSPNAQDIAKKMQNMTPEERQKMIDEIQKKYGKGNN